MKIHLVEKYLLRYRVGGNRSLVADSLEGIEHAVVIPALAERRSLFRTLASVAGNAPDALRSTLVICVVNNHRRPLASPEEIRDNRDTLRLLAGLVFRNESCLCLYKDTKTEIHRILASPLRVAFIDASSPGREISDRDGGVGTARKIGMDAALRILGGGGKGTICCLDADTLVGENYLTAVRSHFAGTKNPAAVAAYAHQEPAEPDLLAAICCYELFMRSYVIGLAFAGSPYAFHTIGSTIACSAEGYVAVRGMNRRGAGEDFHFLNKLAKIGTIGHITETTVMPSARISHRVPFGTGRRMVRHTSAQRDEYRVYDPQIFALLGEWLGAVEADPDRDGESLLADAGRVHKRLEEHLRLNGLVGNWASIRRNCRSLRQLGRQFHLWFDGLKTLRMVHHLSRHEFPLVPMFEGIAQLFHMFGLPFCCNPRRHSIPGIGEQYDILASVRSTFPHS